MGAPKRSRFCTWDLESKDGPTQTAGFTRIFMAGLYDGEDYQAFFDQSSGGDWQTRYFRAGGCVDRLMRTCLQDAYRGYTFYAHNAGNFDFLFLLPWLVKQRKERDLQIGLIPLGNSGLLAIDVWKTKTKWCRWRFVDSVRLLPMSLAAAAKAFGAGKKAHDGAGGQILDRFGNPFTIECPEDDPGWIPYNEQDCRLLYDVLTRAHDFVELEFGGEIGLTLPSTSIKTFRRAHLERAIPREMHTHEFIRKSYVGGRTEVIEEIGHHVGYFDINSSYVHQMTLPMPAGAATIWEKGEPPRHLRETQIGFVECTVEVPDDLRLPPLPVKAEARHFPDGSGVEGKLVFPTGVLCGIWEWGELQNALENGCRILEWKQSIWYESEPILRGFVETLYKYRNQTKCFRCNGPLGAQFHCKKCDAPGWDAALDALAKLLGNGGYGKFAQSPLRGKFYWLGDPEMPEGCTPLIEDDPDCQVWFKEEMADASFILPQISARITALARVHLHRFAMEAMRRILRECRSCHSKVTFACAPPERKKEGSGLWSLGSRGEKKGAEKKGAEERQAEADRAFVDIAPSAFAALQRGLWGDMGGSGQHGDTTMHDRITRNGASCPCGGALETRFGRVYYMDTDAIKTDVEMPTGGELGEWKNELPRYSGFLEGRFYGPKLYRLSVEKDYCELPYDLRLTMLKRDKKFFSSLSWEEMQHEERDEAISGKVPVGEGKKRKFEPFEQVKAKGMGKKNRTSDNLEALYQGALARLAWLANPDNRHPDGRPKKMPKEVLEAGTLKEERLEKVGTLARLVKRNEKGQKLLKRDKATGELHSQSRAFERGPLMRTIPKRLHLEGAKRLHLGDGTTKPYHIDMRKKLGEPN